MAVTLPVEQAEVDQGTKEGYIEGPDAVQYVRYVRSNVAIGHDSLGLNPQYGIGRMRNTTSDEASSELDVKWSESSSYDATRAPTIWQTGRNVSG